MKLIESRWNYGQGKAERTWLADTEGELTAAFDPDSASGSSVFVISAGTAYMKNTQGKWQKIGTEEVIE